MVDRYRKQALFSGIGEAGQQRLLDSRVTLIGCGALGSVIADTLVRAGVGFLRIVDRDFVDLSNLQRQVLFDEADVAERLPKAIAAARKLRAINRQVTLDPQVLDVTPANVLELITGADVILDGTDNFEIRYLLNDAAVETGTPWIHAGCVGSHGQMMSILPGQTPCLRCVMPEIPAPGSSETCDTAGVIGPAVQIMASLQCVDALKILTGQTDLIVPALTVVDVWQGTWRRIDLARLLADGQCPCCQGTERPWLSGAAGIRTSVLCGRNSVQISPGTSAGWTLPQLADRLGTSGNIRVTPFLLIFQPSESQTELTIFPDGRAIITGTEEISEAKSIYARYLGL